MKGRVTKMIEWETLNDEGDEIVVQITSRKEVCPRCDGEGMTWPEGLYFTSIDFEEDPDLQENIVTDMYNIICPKCKGKNVVDVPCESDPNYPAWCKYQDEEEAYQAMVASELRYGC